MLLHSIHTLANLALKKTVPPQPRTSPHVTVKNMYSMQWIQGILCFVRASVSCSKILNVQYSENFQCKLCFSRQAQSCSKTLNVKKYIQCSEIFQASPNCSKILNSENVYNTVYSMYIHFGVIRVIQASVVCNLDQSRDWLKWLWYGISSRFYASFFLLFQIKSSSVICCSIDLNIKF